MENKVNFKLMSMAGQGGSVFGISLIELINHRNDLIVLSSDMSTPAGLDKFKAAYPDHFMNMGIAEQNMIGTAAGLAEEGYKPICVAQACFITMRSFEQVRQYCGYMQIPMVIIGIGSGVSLQYMGNTHYAVEDLALMRTIPGMEVIAPCDSYEAVLAFEYAVNTNHPVYIRLFGGTAIPAVFNEEKEFKCGKAIKMREGKDVQIIATGSMVGNALKVAEDLEAEGIKTSVTDMHTIKPFDSETIEMDKKLIVTLEEHNIIGGLGDAVAAFLSQKSTHPKLLKLGITDRFLPVGSYKYLLQQCGLDVESIKKSIIDNIE
jgi:transketolase